MKKRNELPTPRAKLKGNWKRRFRNLSIVFAFVLLVSCWLIRDHVRTLWSLKHIDGTNIYVMDYYTNYDMDEIRRDGMNVSDIEGSYIDALFPQWVAPFARLLKSTFVPKDVNTVESSGGTTARQLPGIQRMVVPCLDATSTRQMMLFLFCGFTMETKSIQFQ